MNQQTRLYLLLLYLLPQLLFAQIDKKVNHIFLWDVTQSMKGVVNYRSDKDYDIDESKNIYADVQNVITNVISEIEEESGEILILAFQDKVIAEINVKSSAVGIQEAIQFVKTLKNDNLTRTNICGAWQYALTKINPKEKNLIYLLTDGEQSDLSDKNPKWGKDCIFDVVQSYCKLTENSKFTYTFYISLNTQLSSAIKNTICQTCPENLRCSEGTPPSQIIDIQPNRLNQVVNIQDGGLTFTQNFDITGKLPDAFRYDVVLSIPSDQLSTGTRLRLKQSKGLQIINDKTTFELNLSPSQLKELQLNAPEEFYGTLYYKKQDLNSLGLGNQIIEFTPNKVKFTVRNRKEKTLKITILE